MINTPVKIKSEKVESKAASPFQPLIQKFFGGEQFSSDDLDGKLKELLELYDKKDKLIEMELGYQAYIASPPEGKKTLYDRACSNDGVTINSWADQWLRQIKENAKNFDIEGSSVESVIGKEAYKPVIVAGSGPSLKKNAKHLKDKGDICLVSCLHNFAFLEDNGTPADYYINLDAGDITISEMAQGGTENEEFYWEKSKDRTLVTGVVGHPELLKRWRGKILFFNCMIPDPKIKEEIDKIIDLPVFYNVGGNALGAAMYHGKLLGGNPIIYIGADFSFDYTKKFHPFDSPYDQQYQGLMPCTDIYGNRVYTWPSYYNFKCWFDYIACGGEGNNPGIWINATEGGILGAYQEGNIQQIRQMGLKEAIGQYTLHKELPNLIQKRMLMI